MPTGTSMTAILSASSAAIGFLATMIAIWSFTAQHPAWGAFNLVIAVLALLTFIAVRGRGHET